MLQLAKLTIRNCVGKGACQDRSLLNKPDKAHNPMLLDGWTPQDGWRCVSMLLL